MPDCTIPRFGERLNIADIVPYSGGVFAFDDLGFGARDEEEAPADAPAEAGDFVIDFDHAPEAKPVAEAEPASDETVSFEEPAWSSGP